MIFLMFLEIYLMNHSLSVGSIKEKESIQNSTDINSINNDVVPSIRNNYNVKEIIITCSMSLLIYLLLHQVNQDSASSFKFCMYNKILICIMIIDILICLFFISKHIINIGMSFMKDI